MYSLFIKPYLDDFTFKSNQQKTKSNKKFFMRLDKLLLIENTFIWKCYKTITHFFLFG